jgi:hypothetical protein
MVANTARGEPMARPYYVPEAIDFKTLPEPVRLAFQELVEPTYRDLVLGVEGPLERSAGITLTFLLAVEILDQFELGHVLNFSDVSTTERDPDRDRLIGRYLRVVGAKHNAEKFLLRIHAIRAANDRRNAPERGR